MRTTISLNFNQDLVAAALAQVSHPCTLVFPSKISAAVARQRFFDSWDLQDVRFLSMDELKQNLILPDAPAVSEDKRLLCLWQVLEDSDRKYFHLEEYFDLVQWGTSFFQFFDELCDEGVEAEALEELGCSGSFRLLAWQEEHVRLILKLRSRYRDFLASKGFTDRIFFYARERIAPPPGPRRYVFVNQYYYSKLEQALLDILEETGNGIVIISQGLASDPGGQGLTPPAVELEELQPGEIRTRRIGILEGENEEQTVQAFLAWQAKPENRSGASSLLVDRQFSQKQYQDLFDRERFDYPSPLPLSDSQAYWLLQIWHRQLSALADSPEQRFLPLRLILDACSRLEFIRFYHPDWGWDQQRALLGELKMLISKDILYLDQDLELFRTEGLNFQPEYLPRLLKPHFGLLAKLAAIGSHAGLAGFFDSPQGVAVRDLCSERELKFSNILEQFYGRLANFAAADALGLVSSWKGLFGAEGIRLGAKVLRLFLEFLGGARFRYDLRRGERAQWTVSNLLDSRDLSFERVAIFNAIEGEYPGNPAPVWLFNEAQRERLGLKSYAQLRQRERYYFLRQVLSAEQVLIYTHRNQDQDIEPGSFVTELVHARKRLQDAGAEWHYGEIAFPVSVLIQARQLRYPATGGLAELIADGKTCGLDRGDPGSFFILPCEPEKEMAKRRGIIASYYGTAALKRNPFAWYIRYLRGLPELQLRQKETITRKLFGSIMHSFLSKVLLGLEGWHGGTARLEAAFGQVAGLKAILLDLLCEDLYLYKIPQNYNHVFLSEVISDCLAESVSRFYQDFLARQLRGRSFELIPEHEDMTEAERIGPTLCTANHEGISYALRIRGKADLRIESEQENIIVDFKTGRADEDQLAFYEWMYYLLPGSCGEDQLNSLFWQVLDQKRDDKQSSARKRSSWRAEMAEIFQKCLDSGYRLGRRSADLEDLAAVTRADIYRPGRGGEA
jgi:hypothetical protein